MSENLSELPHNNTSLFLAALLQNSLFVEMAPPCCQVTLLAYLPPAASGTEAEAVNNRGSVSRLVSSLCLIYCPATFEVGQAEFTSLSLFVISRPRLQPR